MTRSNASWGLRLGLAVSSVALLLVSSGAQTARSRTSSARQASAEWSAYGRTADVQNAASTSFTVAEAKAFHLIWKAPVGGFLTAQPLYAPAVTVAGRTRPLVIVASGSNVVVALDARTGSLVWKRSLGPTVRQICGGQGGIESTPALDIALGRLYVIGANGMLQALSLATGKPVPGWHVKIIQRTDVETVWGALRVAGNSIYVPVASWCDKGDAAGAWDGELVAVDRTTHRISTRFDVVPGRHNGGGIWGPGGVAIDPADGSIWTATANSVVETNGSLDEDAPFAERVLHLSTKLKVLASVVEPDSNEAVLGDQGFGSTPMLFQPTGCPALLAVNSKDSYTYVWRRSNLASAPLVRKRLGQQGATNDTFYAQPTWFPATRTLVVDGVALPDGSEASGAVGLHISSTCKFSVGWSLNIGGGVEPQPLAAGQVAFVPATAVGKVYAVSSGSGLILNSFDTGGPAYTAPMLADGLVVVGSADGTVRAFGSKPPAG